MTSLNENNQENEQEINQESNNMSTFTLIRQDNGIAHLVMDVIGESMNTLKAEFSEEIAHVHAPARVCVRVLTRTRRFVHTSPETESACEYVRTSVCDPNP